MYLFIFLAGGGGVFACGGIQSKKIFFEEPRGTVTS